MGKRAARKRLSLSDKMTAAVGALGSHGPGLRRPSLYDSDDEPQGMSVEDVAALLRLSKGGMVDRMLSYDRCSLDEAILVIRETMDPDGARPIPESVGRKVAVQLHEFADYDEALLLSGQLSIAGYHAFGEAAERVYHFAKERFAEASAFPPKSRARAAFEARILSEVRCMRLFSESEAKKTARDWANDEVAGEILWPAHAEILLGLEEPLRFSRALRTSRMPNIRALKQAA